MKLLTKEILKKLPPLHGTENEVNPMVQVKFFCPWGSWTWYGIEYCPEQKLFYGFVDGDYPELGYFSLTELESVVGPGGLKIERDLYFTPKTLEEIQAEILKR